MRACMHAGPHRPSSEITGVRFLSPYPFRAWRPLGRREVREKELDGRTDTAARRFRSRSSARSGRRGESGGGTGSGDGEGSESQRHGENGTGRAEKRFEIHAPALYRRGTKRDSGAEQGSSMRSRTMLGRGLTRDQQPSASSGRRCMMSKF